MPLTDAQRSRLPENLRHFTNRNEQLAAFEQLWQNQTPILAFDGMSGNGKSTLIRVLIEVYAKPQQIPYALLDFDDPHGALLRQSAEALGAELVLSYTLDLPASARDDFKARRQRAMDKLAQRRADIKIDQRITASQGSTVSESGQQAQLNLGELYERFEQEFRVEIGAAALDALESHATRPCLLFLDTMERLAEADPHHRDWFWDWLTQALRRYPHLRVVAGSRQRLNLGRDLSHAICLPDLAPEDSDDLLARLGVTDPGWRQAVYERLARGHPLITELAGVLWREMGQDPLPADQIPRLAGHEKALDWLTGKILERLAEPLRSAVRWVALLRYFTWPSLQATLLPLSPALTPAHFEQLRTFSFVEPADPLGGTYACHSLLRQVQSHYLRRHFPAEFGDFHRRAAAYFAEQDDELESLYHGLAAGAEEVLAAWDQLVNQARDNWDWPRWGALLDLADSPELALPAGWPGRIMEKRGWWQHRRGDPQAALETYQQAINLLKTANDEAALGYTYNNIGLIYDARGDYDQALHFYQQSVTIQEKLGNKSGLAPSYNNMAFVYQARGDLAQAIAYFEKSLAILEKIGEKANATIVRENLAAAREMRGEG